jgi:hypothetical protein
MTAFDLDRADLRLLNSLTKYPSILTYHPMGERGRLGLDAPALDGELILTEKIDGTNARMIFTPDGRCLLGSRENLLWSSGDRIGDPAQGIVDALRPTAEGLNERRDAGRFFVLFGELFGGKITGGSRQYTSNGEVSFRLFDAIEFGDEHLGWLESRSAEELSAWREHGGQPFVAEARVEEFAAEFGLDRVPVLCRLPAAEFPRGLEECLGLLQERLPETQVRLDAQAGGRPEGIVIRDETRRQIYKLRFEDYERTLKAGRGR